MSNDTLVVGQPNDEWMATLSVAAHSLIDFPELLLRESHLDSASIHAVAVKSLIGVVDSVVAQSAAESLVDRHRLSDWVASATAGLIHGLEKADVIRCVVPSSFAIYRINAEVYSSPE